MIAHRVKSNFHVYLKFLLMHFNIVLTQFKWCYRHVLNYDFPRNIEEYVHRVGRTGRAGKSGESISYFTRSDWAQAKELISILEEAQQVCYFLNNNYCSETVALF